jgi:dipeptidyl aminopeptidase/acylaminoacyl peptidase
LTNAFCASVDRREPQPTETKDFDMSVRHFFVAVLVCCCIFSFQSVVHAQQNGGGVERTSEDYITFRSRFQSRLTVKGPSPQVGKPLERIKGTFQIEYESDGTQLQAILGIPPKGGKLPVVVFLHGGFAFGDSDWDMAKPFLDAGYVVLMPILRGENQQPGTFSLYYDEVNDVLAATEKLKKHPRVLPDQIFVAGHSAGGTLAILSSMASNHYRGAASLSGSMDVRSERKKPLLVFDTADIDEQRARSPLLFAEHFQCPTMLYYGDQEKWAVKETTLTFEKAKLAKVAVSVKVIKGDHYSSVPEASADAIRFFESLRK